MLLLIALILCAFAAPVINDKIQAAANDDPLPTQNVWNDDTERRFSKMQSQIDTVMKDMQRLQMIYGPEGLGCESMPDAAAFTRCRNVHRAQQEQAAIAARERAYEERPR